MLDTTPEQKLLNLIKQAKGRWRLKKDLKFFTKINIILIGLIIVIIAIFLVDIFTFDYEGSEFNIDLPSEDLETLPLADLDIALDEEAIEKKPLISKENLVKNLNLLGIITGENTQAVIEDKEKKKTFFLYQGDSFGEFTVYDIKDSEVILDYKDEKIALHM